MTQTARVHPTQADLPSENPSKSYWHTQPSEKLLGHRTTSDLPDSADVIIVGSGISGTFAAQALREKRPELKVVMLEAREACWGATGRVSHVALNPAVQVSVRCIWRLSGYGMKC